MSPAKGRGKNHGLECNKSMSCPLGAAFSPEEYLAWIEEHWRSDRGQ